MTLASQAVTIYIRAAATGASLTVRIGTSAISAIAIGRVTIEVYKESKECS